MTEDISPENLRKFLESDDPALVRMGLSMAKGSGVPEELLPTILSLYMWDDNETIRATAKVIFNKYADEEDVPEEVLPTILKLYMWENAAQSIFFKNAPKDLQTKVEENWQTFKKYAPRGTGSITLYGKLNRNLLSFLLVFAEELGEDFLEIASYPYIAKIDRMRVNGFEIKVCEAALQALREIGDVSAVDTLIKLRNHICTESDWEIELLEDDVIKTLAQIGGGQAVDYLIKAFSNHPAREAYIRMIPKKTLTPVLRERGLPVSGSQKQLIQRIMDVK